MELLVLIAVISSVLLSIVYVLRIIALGKYKIINNDSIVKVESIEKFKEEYPEKDIKDLKIEIEKISDMLLDNQESNRYTNKIQEKAKNDYKLDAFRDAIVDNVEILKYNKGKLKAQVNYILDNVEYTLIMDMEIVKKGRAFLKNYKTIKRILVKNT